ncbi:hypothetical protein P170DRAFT_483657 [Aspergillus steynii IBT 23096]|uniref:DUF4470 domain-containing protein n=1 Tax=Aspergillus steynii IBT 23096 TaxID=1392250 RepID=A0A2I2GPS6_9EURO|nr:uncharacterized protein P170DRAFT_483657 [Aspergillus steynii IBT 23096]PLB54875.1 hypothetical protein P170DRAFT_483657 [Aspergillus steynii IBT 23096]
MAVPKFICANWSPDQTDCNKEGKYTCKNCRLILTDSTAVQTAKSLIGLITRLTPAWVLENRTPEFIRSGIVVMGEEKYLWGNVPALDVLKLASNEGESYGEDLRLLFAASGDLRNVIKTLTDLPVNYNQSVSVTINDRDFDVVARNIILTLVALVVDDRDKAIDCIIHIWYSALVRDSDIDILWNRVRPLVQEICEEVNSKPPGALLAKTWKFGNRSLRVVLEQSSWNRLLSYFRVPAGLTPEQAIKVRTNNTLDPSRQDYRDRHMSVLSPVQRIPFHKFRQDGLLLPFGMPRHEFNNPNPTLYQTPDSWPMPDSADPLNSWSLEDVLHTSSGPATADTYGKLYFHLRGVFGSFMHRISDAEVSFEFHHVDASYLPNRLQTGSFSRIDNANYAVLGVEHLRHRISGDTLYLMIPLLQPHTENPHATVITLFMNAIDQVMTDADRMQIIEHDSRIKKDLPRFLPQNTRPCSPYDPSIVKMVFAGGVIARHDHIFNRYQNGLHFREAGEAFGARMKKRHTIVDRWPCRLKLRPDQAGAQEEFDRCMRQGNTGKERFVEWKRME